MQQSFITRRAAEEEVRVLEVCLFRGVPASVSVFSRAHSFRPSKLRVTLENNSDTCRYMSHITDHGQWNEEGQTSTPPRNTGATVK